MARIKKGYIIILVFSAVNAIGQALKYRLFIHKDLSWETSDKFIVQIVSMFLVVSIPGLLLVRWYYKLKSK